VVWGELQLTDLGPHCWTHPTDGGLKQEATRRAKTGPALWGGGGDILPLGRLAAY
jgi:hypothetical protein